jgi:hypothetical protein
MVYTNVKANTTVSMFMVNVSAGYGKLWPWEWSAKMKPRAAILSEIW